MKYQRQQLKWNGWGWAGKSFDFEGREEAFLTYLSKALGIEKLKDTPSVSLEEVPLNESRISVSQYTELTALLSESRVKSDRFERLFHAVGKSYHDLIRLRKGELAGAPDAVVYPESELEIQGLIKLAEQHSWALIPFGGGSSVVGGVEGSTDGTFEGVVTVDLTLMKKVLEIDEESLIARVQPGLYGPELEDRLQKRGYTLGHYPQSFEFSTIGGWVAARGAGQQSNRYGSAARFFVGARVVSPSGVFETKSFPNSSAGPDLKHIIAGSEGIFGFITEVSVQLHKVPSYRDYRSYLLPSFSIGAKVIKEIVQGEIDVAMLRLSDEDETEFYSTISELDKEETWVKGIAKRAMDTIFPDRPCVLMVGLEGSRGNVLQAGLQIGKICLQHKGVPLGGSVGDKWFETRFETPYLRDHLLDKGIGIDTLETATSWSNLERLYSAVRSAIQDAIEQWSKPGEFLILTHISHSYKTGASLYFSYLFEQASGREKEQWLSIKRAASDAIRDYDGTISHHHGVGVDHCDWMEPEKGSLGIAILQATKSSLDPKGLMNPGKVLP